MTKKQTPDPIADMLAGKSQPSQPEATDEAGPVAVPNYGTVRPLGVGLTEGEIDTLQAIADELDISRHAVARFGLYYFLKDYLNGGPSRQALVSSIETPEVKQPTKRVKLP
jgi:hypothetical protein